MIKLNDVLNIQPDELKDYTIALNNPTGYEKDPLDYYLSESDDFLRYIGWYKSHNAKRAFRRLDTKYTLQFVRIFSADQWLFVGCYTKDNNMKSNEYGKYYNLILDDKFKNLEGRLIVNYKKVQGPKQAKLSSAKLLNEDFTVKKILEEKYSGKHFPGYNNVNISFYRLQQIVFKQVTEWKEQLSTVKGVYLITDTKTSKLYVGSAYGDEGIWGRWTTYAYTNGTGGNKDLKLVMREDKDYAINHFQFAILDYYKKSTSEDEILARESFWKEVLQSRGDLNYNNN